MKPEYHIKIEYFADNPGEADDLYQEIFLLAQKHKNDVNKFDFWEELPNNVCEFKTTGVESSNSQLEKIKEFIIGHNLYLKENGDGEEKSISDTVILLLKNAYFDVPQKVEVEDFTSNKYNANYEKLKSMIAIDPAPPEW